MVKRSRRRWSSFVLRRRRWRKSRGRRGEGNRRCSGGGLGGGLGGGGVEGERNQQRNQEVDAWKVRGRERHERWC